MMAFCLATCVVGILAGVTLIAFPVSLGRQIFSFVVAEHVHDGYSFILGCSLFWACFFTGKQIDQSLKRRGIRLATQDDDDTESHVPTPAGASAPLYLLKGGIHWFSRAAWLLFFIGFAIPFLMALVVDLYLILPLRFIITPDLLPRLNVLETWALGVVYLKLFIRIMRHHDRNAETDIVAGIEKVNKKKCCC
jgi:E3 ubiquitin-protein ligase MARCH6